MMEKLRKELERIEKWKGLREDLFRNIEPAITTVAVAMPTDTILREGFVTPESLPAFTARQSHESVGGYEDDLSLGKRLIQWGHTTPLEALTFTFRVTGISKSLAGQWTRHRVGIGWTFRSTRYVDSSENGFVYPALEYIKSEEIAISALRIYEMEHQRILQQIENLKLLKVANQECRRLQPVGFATSAFVYTNARALRNFFALRVDAHAEWEHRRFAIMLFNVCMGIAPSLFEDMIPSFSFLKERK